MILRENLIKLRKAKSFTQAQMAKKLGISTRQYRALEAGTSDGSIKVWCSLKELLGKSIDYLLEQKE